MKIQIRIDNEDGIQILYSNTFSVEAAVQELYRFERYQKDVISMEEEAEAL